MTSPKRKRSGIMLAKPFEERYLEKWPKRFLVQPKIDGLRCRAKIERGKVELFSSTSLPINSVPHIVSELAALSECLHNPWELDGELSTPDFDFQRTCSIVKRNDVHPEHKDINFHIFDIVSKNTQLQRMKWLDSIIPIDNPDLIRVDTFLSDSFQDAMEFLSTFMVFGYEGIIFRHPNGSYEAKRSSYLLKLKPQKSDEYRIIGYQEEIDKYGIPKDSLGAFICTKDSLEFSVGTGPALTKAGREKLWVNRKDLPGKILVVKYQNLTRDRQVPRCPVALEVKDV